MLSATDRLPAAIFESAKDTKTETAVRVAGLNEIQLRRNWATCLGGGCRR